MHPTDTDRSPPGAHRDILVWIGRSLAANHTPTAAASPEDGLADLTYVDVGHHVNLGILGPLVDELASGGSSAAVVRVIRNRFDTVRSFMSERKAPCASNGTQADGDSGATMNGMWTLCPELHKVLLQPPPGAWARLDDDQRNLWFIDEVEARWQQLLLAHPALEQLTLSWCEDGDFPQVWDATAQFIGGGSDRLRRGNCSSHVHTATSNVTLSTDAQLARKDDEYRRLMAYTPAVMQTIRATQQATVCHGVARRAARESAARRSHLQRGGGVLQPAPHPVAAASMTGAGAEVRGRLKLVASAERIAGDELTVVDVDGALSSLSATFAGEPADSWERFRSAMRGCTWERAAYRAAYNHFKDQADYHAIVPVFDSDGSLDLAAMIGTNGTNGTNGTVNGTAAVNTCHHATGQTGSVWIAQRFGPMASTGGTDWHEVMFDWPEWSSLLKPRRAIWVTAVSTLTVTPDSQALVEFPSAHDHHSGVSLGGSGYKLDYSVQDRVCTFANDHRCMATFFPKGFGILVNESTLLYSGLYNDERDEGSPEIKWSMEVRCLSLRSNARTRRLRLSKAVVRSP